MLLSFLMLGAGFLSSLFPFFSIPTVFAGMILPEVLLHMPVCKNKQYAVLRMHFNMIDIIGRMIVSQVLL